MLAMRPADDAGGGGEGGGGEGGGGGSVERGTAADWTSSKTRLNALDHLVRLGFDVLTEPSAHAAEPAPLIAAWRRTFALAATLRGNSQPP